MAPVAAVQFSVAVVAAIAETERPVTAGQVVVEVPVIVTR
jgi:hypothetical protein